MSSDALAAQKNTDYFKRQGEEIFAKATALGGPVCILRVSAPCLQKVWTLIEGDKPKARKASLRKVAGLDESLVIFFEKGASFTGEEVLEIQCHGSYSIVEAIEKKLKSAGLVEALPGEFSFRAVSHGVMSLDQAERLNQALSDSGLRAEAAGELIGFSKSQSQKMSQEFRDLRGQLFALRGRLESAIDFPEATAEQDEDTGAAKKMAQNLVAELETFEGAFESFSKASKIPSVALIGARNVGKSTLLNLLCGTKRSIVSQREGSTRDWVEAPVNLGGQSFRFMDTAGLSSQEIDDELEIIGQQEARAQSQRADIVIWVARSQSKLKASDLEISADLEIFSHKDQSDQDHKGLFDFRNEAPAIKEYLKKQIERLLEERSKYSHMQNSTKLLSQRQAQLLGEMRGQIAEALQILEKDGPLEIAAICAQGAEQKCQELLGQDLGEEYIGEIFSQFCLGK